MEFRVIDFDEKELWGKITKNREVYYQWQYVDAFYKNGDGIPKLAYACDGDNYAINVFFLRNINEDLNLEDSAKTYYDIITPYGYGGVDIKDYNDSLLNYYFSEFEKYCISNDIVSEFVRLCPFTNNYKNYRDNYDVSNISKTVYIKLDNPEQIWNDMEGRCRRAIKRAQRYSLIVKPSFSKESIGQFKKIYFDTMSRDNADNYYFFNDDFYESIYENLGDFSTIYTTYLDDRPIGSIIAIYNGASAHYHLSGTLSEYINYGSNNLGLYEIAVDLCKKGYKSFHLGGGYGGDNSPLLKFKQSFNKYGNLDFYVGKKIWNQKVYDELCKKVGVSENEDFFPAYRKGLK